MIKSIKTALIIVLFAIAIASTAFAQQQSFWSIGEVVPDSSTIHDYFNSKWQKEKTLNVKTIESYDCDRKGNRKALYSREEFNPELGMVKGVYFNYKKKKDYKTLSYSYDSLNRITKIDVDITFIPNYMDLELFYNDKSQIVKCLDGNRHMLYTYRADGRKNSIEFSERENSFADKVVLGYYYDNSNRMKGFIYGNDSTELYIYAKDTVEFNGYGNWIETRIFSNNQLTEMINTSYTSNPLIQYVEIVKYIYDEKTLNLIEKQVSRNSYKKKYSNSIVYSYDENGLLKTIIKSNQKGKITSYKECIYTFFQ